MTENEPEQIYPVKTLHDFLSEFNKEWYRFKRGTLISLTILSTLLAAFICFFPCPAYGRRLPCFHIPFYSSNLFNLQHKCFDCAVPFLTKMGAPKGSTAQFRRETYGFKT